MNEVIENVLSDETYVTNEEKVEAIKKGLATLVIPKDKYNDLSTRLKTSESNYSTLQNEFNDYKKSKMTEDELNQAKENELAEKVKQNNIKASELAVKSLLLDNGIKVTDEDTELKETLQNIISEDLDKSIKLTNSFISLLNKTKTNTEKETTTKLLKDTPKPIGGVDSSSNVTKLESLQKELQQAIKDKDVIKQTSLMTQIFQEQNKPKI
ncbi:MAG: hypothetical protein E7174_02155 [Firmicutes bacterium]|nr:hypothetical protein [Bacillota bacterium]